MRVIALIGTGFSALLMLSIPRVHAGTANAADYKSVTRTFQLIGKKTPVITWPAPSAINYGVALSAVQLNATADVAGEFVYTPAGGTVLAAGTHTLSVNFKPKDKNRYKEVKAEVQLTVLSLDPVITWANPAPITYGVALGPAQLNATADVPGTFNYSPPAGTVLTVGTNQTLNTEFTPTDPNYNPTTDTASITVNPESPLNHPPTLTNVESAAIEFDLADQPTPVTQELILSDVDDSFMCSARITLTENYKIGDLLTWDGSSNPKITSTFNSAKGELVLTGKDLKSNYETALRNVFFSRPVSGDTSLSIKTVGIVVKDSSAESNMASRTIKVTNEFPELSIVSAFTPNSDRVNDYWDFKNLQFYKQIKIAVFNEDGVRVFDCGDKACKWDGKNRGNELPAGPYFYSISLNDGKRTYRGTVTILK